MKGHNASLEKMGSKFESMWIFVRSHKVGQDLDSHHLSQKRCLSILHLLDISETHVLGGIDIVTKAWS